MYDVKYKLCKITCKINSEEDKTNACLVSLLVLLKDGTVVLTLEESIRFYSILKSGTCLGQKQSNEISRILVLCTFFFYVVID